MKRTLKIAYIAMLLVILCVVSPLSLASTRGAAPSPEQDITALQSTSDNNSNGLTNWDLDNTESFLERATIKEWYVNGKLYEDDFALVYVPNNIGDTTNVGFFFPGNNYGYALPDYYVLSMCFKAPKSVYIFVKESGLATLGKEDGVLYRCRETLKGVCKDFETAPNQVGVVGFSNGGYTALHAAANLIDEFHLYLPKVTILDMGQAWGKGEFLISEEQAKPLLDAGTEVYHFTRHGETGHNRGSIQFASYGIPLYEVACVYGDHTDIMAKAFTHKTLLWAIGDVENLNEEIYTSVELVNEDAVNSHKPVEEEIADTEDIATDGAVA